jgi:hypothetical protein
MLQRTRNLITEKRAQLEFLAERLLEREMVRSWVWVVGVWVVLVWVVALCTVYTYIYMEI